MIRSNSASVSSGINRPGAMMVPAAVSQRWLNGSIPIVTVNNGRGRNPSAGAVAERIAIPTRASARRCWIVRSTP